MFKKIYTTFLIALTSGTVLLAQGGILKGKAIDGTSGEGISFANVQIEQGGNAVGKTVADIDGNFTIKPIPPGEYDVKVASVGYQTYFSKGVIIGGDKTTYIDAKIQSTAITKDPIVIVEYVVPLVDPDTKTGGTITKEQFDAMPSKNINSVASTTAGVFQADEGSALSLRGGRKNTDANSNPSGQNSGNSTDGGSTKYYIDGVPARGTAGLPQSDIEQVSVITGGVPAQYGDATGGFVNITTRGGIRPDYYGGVELVSSQLTDKYGYNLGDFSVGGPLMSKKDSSGHKNPKVDFFLSGQVGTVKDPHPSAGGLYEVNAAKLSQLEQHPLQLSETGAGLIPSSDFLTMNDMQHIQAAQNVRSNTATFGGKVDFKPSDKITITLGGSMDYSNNRDFIYAYSLLNPSQNPQDISNNIRMYGKITGKLGRQRSKDEKSTALITNAYYTLQVSYGDYKRTIQDANNTNNFFNYQYVGKFQTYKVPVYVKDTDMVHHGYKQDLTQYADSAVKFTPSTINPLAANYTSDYYALEGTPQTLTDIEPNGLRNGDRPPSPYLLWNNTGRTYGSYTTSEEGQLRATATISGDIKNHALQAGFEYEKRSDRRWELVTSGNTPLWQLARTEANSHFAPGGATDTSKHNYQLVNGTWYDMHPYLVSGPESQFAKSLRSELGVAGNQWVDVDNLNPSQLSINMFSPDELLNSGSSLIGYNGYSPYGNKLTGTSFNMTALESFFKDKDANGNFTRNIPAFQPVYMAGYIQDKFDIKDMKFNIGMRVDIFNANQPVLQDKYLLYETYKVSDGLKFNHPGYSIPTNMGSNYAVYVDNVQNPTKVIGYRNGDTWYNAQGIIVSDSKLIESNGSIQPYLKYPHEGFLDTSKVSNVFQMYSTQVNLMPRIAFSFPISDRANFFAHYDVLTQRPPAAGQFNPTNYLFIADLYGAAIDNPALKPERTTDYELGFTQVLNERKNAALTISAFYREMRDMLQLINVADAYPATYVTYGNVDFGNVKGLTVKYDLRRTQSSQLTASYTLQFADGTGSAASSAANVISGGEPNLRTTSPLDFDQRHAIVLNYDYRFGSGKDYRGPQAAWAKAIFQNLGGNLIFRAGSGLPYSRQLNVTTIQSGQNNPPTLEGDINGSNLPWQYRFDLRIDKNFQLKWGKGTDEKAKRSNLTIYLQVLNLLNTQNILSVYRHTGDPKDDGYLSYPGTQGTINGQPSPQAFVDLYNAYLANPANYSMPRQTRIGIILNF